MIVIFSAFWGPLYCVDKKKFESGGYIQRLILAIPAAIFTITFNIVAIYYIKRQKNILVEKIQISLNQQKHLTLILENLEESLIIIHDQQIEYVNDKYLEMFMYQINQLTCIEQDEALDS